MTASLFLIWLTLARARLRCLALRSLPQSLLAALLLGKRAVLPSSAPRPCPLSLPSERLAHLLTQVSAQPLLSACDLLQ